MSLAGQEAFAFESLINQQAVDSEFIDFSTYGLTSGQLIAYNDPDLVSVSAGSGLSLAGNILSNTGILSILGTANQILANTASGTTTLSTPQNINLTATPTFAGLTLTGLTGVLKTIAGVIQGNATTDDLTEGKTNLYFTNARAQGAFTPGTGITITAGNIAIGQDVATTSNATFNKLTLSSITPLKLSSILFSNSILYCDSSLAGEVGPLNISANLKITGSGGLYLLDTKQNLQTTSAPTFAGLTLTGLNGILKATAGIISNGATTDDLTEGKTNLYFTTARAQGAFTPGTGITITAGTIANSGVTAITAGTNIITSNIAGNYTINTTTNPTFNNLTITSMSSNVPDGVSLGTNAGASGRYNAYIGTQAGTGSVGSGNVGIGYQALAGAGSGCFGLGFTAGFNALTNGNICIGGSAGQNILTGSGYNIYIGGSPSSSNVSYESVIGAAPSAPVGKGSNTCFIPNTGGLFSYSPAYCQLRSTAFNNGIITWEFWTAGPTTFNNGFFMTNSNRQVNPPFPALYEVTISGGAQAQASLFASIDLNVINVRFYNIAYHSSAGIAGFIVNVSGTQLTRPPGGYEVYCYGANFFSLNTPLYMTIKFISL
jgi:hypothetical protein